MQENPPKDIGLYLHQKNLNFFFLEILQATN